MEARAFYTGTARACDRYNDAMQNKLYFGDNLDILRRHIPDESIDLIYVDPPFNSKP